MRTFKSYQRRTRLTSDNRKLLELQANGNNFSVEFQFRVQFSSISLVVFALRSDSSFQYGYRKYETHALVLSNTIAHVHSKNEIRQRNQGRRQAEKSEHEK